MDWSQLLLAIGSGLLLLWIVLLCLLWISQPNNPDSTSVRDALPASSGRDPAAAPSRRRPGPAPGRTGQLPTLGYLLLPVDLVPDFIPVLGYADDVIVVAVALRAVVRCAGPHALARHWPGNPDGLRTLHRLVGLAAPIVPGDQQLGRSKSSRGRC